MSRMLRRLSFVKCFSRSLSSVKSFKEIPGPKPWPILGNAFLFSPWGPYKIEQLVEGFADLQRIYGDIIHLKLGQDTVVTFSPDDIRVMFHHEGRYPKRPTFEALKKYRQDKFNCVGIVPDNGEEWHRFRQTAVELLRLQTVRSYWKQHMNVAHDFSNYLLADSNANGEVHNFLHYASLYALEAVGVLCYGRRLHCLSANNIEGKKIAEANGRFLHALSQTFHGLPFWKLWKTKAYKELESTQNFMAEIAGKYLKEAKEKIVEDGPLFAQKDPFLYKLFTDPNLTATEVILLVTELYQAGIDATATTITMMLYNLARNPTIQNTLAADLEENPLQPGHSPPLLRACLKESLRLYPPGSANSRILDSDAVLSGYHIPKGTLVIGVNPVLCRMKRYFDNPSKFYPWRWLDDKKKDIHPYSVLPFGHGARMCPGRRFAEQEILICVSQIIRRYHVVSFNQNEVGMILATNLVPDQPLSFGFIPRN